MRGEGRWRDQEAGGILCLAPQKTWKRLRADRKERTSMTRETKQKEGVTKNGHRRLCYRSFDA